MTTIFFSIIKTIAKWNLFIFAMAIATSLVAKRIGFNELSGVIGILLLMTGFFGPMETSRKVPMLLSFPFSRNRLIALCGSVNLVAAMMTAFMMTSYYYVLFLFEKKSVPLNLKEAFFTAWGASGISDFSEIERSRLASTLLLGLSVGIILIFATSNSQNIGKMNQSTFPNRDKKTQITILTVVYSFLALISFFSFQSPFLLTAMIILGLNFAASNLVAITWVFSTKRKFKWIFSFLTIGLFQIGFLYFSIHRSINSEKISEKLFGVEQMGIIGPKVNADFIRKVVALPLSPKDAERLVELMAPKDLTGKVLWYTWNATQAKIPFRELLANQNAEDTVDQFVSLYDPATLTTEDLEFVLNLEKNKKDVEKWKVLPGKSAWLTLQLEKKFVLNLMAASETYKNQFAILYTAFHPNKDFIEPLATGLRSSFSWKLIPSGIQALSIHIGKSLDLRSYLEAVALNGRRKFLDIDCSKYNFGALLSLDDSRLENHFNRCVRELAKSRKNSYAVSQIYKWYSLPLTDFDKKYLKEAFAKTK